MNDYQKESLVHLYEKKNRCILETKKKCTIFYSY